MNAKQFEARVLHLWMTTRIPFTRANLQFLTGAPRKKLERWLDELTRSEVLDLDVDESGEMLWSVKGAVRPKSGPTDPAEFDRLQRAGGNVNAASTALALIRRGSGLPATRAGGPPAVSGPKRKSLIASGALSFFLGPFGWLYAAPLKEAVPAIVAWMLLWAIVPKVILLPFLSILSPLMGAIGVGYAWRHNQTGQRTPLLPPKR